MAIYYYDEKGNLQELKEENERTWFQKGAFEDGYQFGDVSKTIRYTFKDIFENLYAGGANIIENTVDTALFVVGTVGNLFGAEDFSDSIQEIIAKDLINEQKIGFYLSEITDMALNPMYALEKVTDTENIKSVINALKSGNLNFWAEEGMETTEKYSVLGDKSDSLVQAGGQLAAQAALAYFGGVPWQATSAVTSFGSEVESAFRQDAGYLEAGLSGGISAGAEILSEMAFDGISFGSKTVSDVVNDSLTQNISNKALRTFVNLGIDALGEGTEELVSGALSALGQKVTYAKDKDIGELFSKDEALESFIGGAVLGLAGGAVNYAKSKSSGVDYTSQLTSNEEKVVLKVYEDYMAQATTDGKKLTNKDKISIYDNAINDLKKGNVSINVIEQVLGGDKYKSYKQAISSEAMLQNEIELLKNKTNLTLNEQTKYESLKQQLDDLKISSNKYRLKVETLDNVMKGIKEDNKTLKNRNSYLLESYKETIRMAQSFNADLSQYDGNARFTVEKAVNSKILNDTYKVHEMVDMLARISEDKNMNFDFVDYRNSKNTSDVISNKYVVANDNILFNAQSSEYLNPLVGSEIANAVKNTGHYELLNEIVNDFAKENGDYEVKLTALQELYKNASNFDVSAKLTSDLAGDYILNSEAFANKLSDRSSVLFNEIYNEIKYLYEIAPKSSQELQQLERAKNYFENIYKDNGIAKKVAAEKTNRVVNNPVISEGGNSSNSIGERKNPNIEINSDEQSIIENLCEKLGRRVVFEDLRNIESKDGYIISPEGFIKDGVIHINIYAKNPIAFVFKHELTHFGEKTQGYKEFVNQAKKSSLYKIWLEEKTNESNIEVAEYKYKKAILDSRSDIYSINDPKADSELIADFAGDMLFKDNGSGMAAIVNNVNIKYQNKIVRFIVDFISYIKKKIGGQKFITYQLSVLEDSFNRMISEASDLEYKNIYQYDSDTYYCFVRCEDKEIISAALEMEKNNENAEQIFKKLGVIRNAYGLWLSELSTRNLKIFLEGNAATESHYFNNKLKWINGVMRCKLKDIIVYKKLFDLYPKLADVNVRIKYSFSKYDTVRYLPSINEIFINKELYDQYINKENKKVKSYLLGAIQSVIQTVEGRSANMNIEAWQQRELEGRMPYSEEWGRYYTPDEAYNYIFDRYEYDMVKNRYEAKEHLLYDEHYSLTEIKDKKAYLPYVDFDRAIVFDKRGNAVTAREYAISKGEDYYKSSIRETEEDIIDENETESEIFDEKEFSKVLENSQELKSFLRLVGLYKRTKMRKNLSIRVGSDDLISNVAEDAETAAEHFNKKYIEELSILPINKLDSAGRLLNDALQEQFANSIFKNSNGQLVSLYSLKMPGSGGFKYSHLGLVVGTLESVETEYFNYKESGLKNHFPFINEMYVNMKNPIVLPFTPYENSIHGLGKWLVENKVLRKSHYNRFYRRKNVTKPPKYYGLSSRELRARIKAKGYDGILYFNNSTDPGSMSVVVFDEDQIVTVSKNGILQENNGVSQDYLDINTVDELTKKVNNIKNMQDFSSDFMYTNRYKRFKPDDRIRAGSSGFMEHTEDNAQSALEKLEKNLMGKSQLELSGKDTVDRSLDNKVQNLCLNTLFKDENGNLISFFTQNTKELNLQRALYKGKPFGTLDSAINKWLNKKEKSHLARCGAYEEFYINSVNPYIVKLDEWNTKVIADGLLEIGKITEKSYHILFAKGSTNMRFNAPAARRLVPLMELMGYDSVILVNSDGEYKVIPFRREQVVLVAQNGILSRKSGISQIDDTHDYLDENYKFYSVVIDSKRCVDERMQKIKEALSNEMDNTEKLKTLTEIIMCKNQPKLDDREMRISGHSGAFEKGTLDVWRGRATITAFVNAENIRVADTDTAGRKLSKYKKQLLKESSFKDKYGRPISVFAFNKHGEYRFGKGQIGMYVSTLTAAHDISLEERKKHHSLRKYAFEEYYPIVKNPYHILFDPQNLTPKKLAGYMLQDGMITNYQYNKFLARPGYEKATNGTYASNYIIKFLTEKGFDAVTYMNENADPGSIAMIVFDKRQLIPVAIDGVAVENSDRTLADPEDGPAFFDDENIVEKDRMNLFDNSIEKLYNKTYKSGLTEDEKNFIREQTGWSDLIIDYIRSLEEAQIYIEADLIESEINGKRCLIRDDIDIEEWAESKDASPKNIEGETIVLHHIGQKSDSPLAELTGAEHIKNGNDSILHDKKKKSEIIRSLFNTERKKYWRSRLS